MSPEQEKTLQKLTESIEKTYGSPGRMFWRGLLWGLGRGVGNLIGFLVLLAVLFYVFKSSGLDETFREVFRNFQKVLDTLQRISPAP